MKVTIKGRYFSKEKRQILTDFAEWCGKKLLNPQLRKNITIVIHVSGPKMFQKDRIYGLTIPDDTNHRSRHFVIRITNKFEILRSLMILAHEMVHVKQHATKELTFCGYTGTPKWQGIKHNDDPENYWDLPWEIEAHGREKGLVYQWAHDRGYCDQPWFKEVF